VKNIGFLKNKMNRFFVQARNRRLSLEILLIFSILTTSIIFSQSYGLGMSLSRILVPCILGLLFSRFISTTKWAKLAGWLVEICAAVLFYLKISQGIKNGISIYDFLSDLLPLFLILYTFKLVNSRDIKFFTLIPFSVAVFVAGVSPSSLFSLNAIVLSLIIVGLITGCPMLSRIGDDKNIQREWSSVFKRYVFRLFFIVFGLTLLSEAIAPSKIIKNLGGNVQVGIENITPYRYTNFSSDIVPRSSYSGFSPYLSLKGKQAVHLSEDPAMEVTGPPTYWRGIVFDKYTGNSWEVSRMSTKPIHSNPSINGFELTPQEYRYFDFEKEDEQWIKIGRSVTFLKSHGNFLFTPWIPKRISFGPINNFLSISNVHLNQSPTGAVLTPFETQEDFSYQVENVLIESEELKLKPQEMYEIEQNYGVILNSSGLVDPFDRDSLNTQNNQMDYSSLPELSERLKGLVFSISGDGDERQKMLKMSIYLKENMEYTLETAPLPEGEESTDWFVFESQEGWCEMFASSLAVMGRVLNIKTRVIGGYQQGEKIAGKAGYLIRDKDAHTWVEFWSPGYGWTAIDPTPESTLLFENSEIRNEELGTFGQVKKVVDGLVENLEFLTWSNQLDFFWASAKKYLIGIFAFVCLYLFFVFVKNKNLFSRKSITIRKIKKWILSARRDGVVKSKNETLREFALRWYSKSKKMSIIDDLESYECLLYGKSSFF